MINCGSVGCDAAKDTISVKLKDGELGEFTEIININNRALDDRWNNDVLQFEVKNDKIWVFFYFFKYNLVIYNSETFIRSELISQEKIVLTRKQIFIWII